MSESSGSAGAAGRMLGIALASGLAPGRVGAAGSTVAIGSADGAAGSTIDGPAEAILLITGSAGVAGAGASVSRLASSASVVGMAGSAGAGLSAGIAAGAASIAGAAVLAVSSLATDDISMLGIALVVGSLGIVLDSAAGAAGSSAGTAGIVGIGSAGGSDATIGWLLSVAAGETLGVGISIGASLLTAAPLAMSVTSPPIGAADAAASAAGLSSFFLNESNKPKVISPVY